MEHCFISISSDVLSLQFKYLVLFTESWFISWRLKREGEDRSRKLRRALWCSQPASLSPLWWVGKSSAHPSRHPASLSPLWWVACSSQSAHQSHHCILSRSHHLKFWHQEPPDRSRQARSALLQTATWMICGFVSWLLLGSLCCSLLGWREAWRCGSPCPAAPSSPPSSTPPSPSPSAHRSGCWKAQQQNWRGWSLLKFFPSLASSQRDARLSTTASAVTPVSWDSGTIQPQYLISEPSHIAICTFTSYVTTYALYLQRVLPFYLLMNTSRSQNDPVSSLLQQNCKIG